MDARAILVNRKASVPLHRQLEGALRNAILTGQLAAGERILSSRELQTHLGLSRNTIQDALGQLHAEGYLVTVRGVGTFVAEHAQRRPERRSADEAQSVVPSEAAAGFLSLHPLAANLQAPVPFRPGLPALDLFPATKFKRCFNTTDWTAAMLDYPPTFGAPALREAVAQRLQQTRGVICDPDQILITAGAQAAFTLIAKVTLRKNDLAVIENPGYPNVRAVLLAPGARLFAAPVDDAGIDVSSFEKRRAKLAYVTPSHQYPSGAVLSLERRFALLEWAGKHDAWIVEDDYDSEFNYTNRPQPALQGLGEGRRVIYTGTFSKVLSPALRIAYLVVPRALRAAFEAAQQVTSGSPDMLLQLALARFMELGHLSRHIAKMRKVYDERRIFVAAELAKIGALRIRDSRAGLHFIAELPAEVRDAEISQRAASVGLVVPPLSGYFHGKAARNGLVIGYAATPVRHASRAVGALDRVLETLSETPNIRT
jgi:GntR family transcriptional regulator/MocR family aminotransferase